MRSTACPWGSRTCRCRIFFNGERERFSNRPDRHGPLGSKMGKPQDENDQDHQITQVNTTSGARYRPWSRAPARDAPTSHTPRSVLPDESLDWRWTRDGCWSPSPRHLRLVRDVRASLAGALLQARRMMMSQRMSLAGALFQARHMMVSQCMYILSAHGPPKMQKGRERCTSRSRPTVYSSFVHTLCALKTILKKDIVRPWTTARSFAAPLIAII